MQVHSELELEVPVEHGLLLENLLDLAHAPFTHTSTFAKGWPIPDVVRFNAAKLLGGNWEPYPIDMSFEPPCIVLSTIGKPAKLKTWHKFLIENWTWLLTGLQKRPNAHVVEKYAA